MHVTSATITRANTHGRYRHQIGNVVTDAHEAAWQVAHGFAVAGHGGDEPSPLEAGADVTDSPGVVSFVDDDDKVASVGVVDADPVAPAGEDDGSLKIPDAPTPRASRGKAKSQEA